MIRFAILAALAASAASAQVPNPDIARAAAVQVDQAMQSARTAKESMDRTAPLLTVEPHKDPEDAAKEKAWREAKEAEAKKAMDAPKPK